MINIEDKIIFEDNHIIVVIKDQNILSQGDETGDESLFDAIKSYIKTKYNKEGNVFLGLVHRLDRPTGGVMVFAKTSKAAERLCEEIREGGFEKKYLAIVNGNPKEKSGILVHYLEKNEQTNVVKALSFNKEGTKKAVLNYNVLNEVNGYSLVEVNLETGRSHQIRVQFASIGHSIFGDVKYKGDTKKGYNMALWAYKLSFTHPTTKQRMVYMVLPDVDEVPWNLFESIKKIKV